MAKPKTQGRPAKSESRFEREVKVTAATLEERRGWELAAIEDRSTKAGRANLSGWLRGLANRRLSGGRDDVDLLALEARIREIERERHYLQETVARQDERIREQASIIDRLATEFEPALDSIPTDSPDVAALRWQPRKTRAKGGKRNE